MGGLFSSPKTVSAPMLQKESPPPEVISEEIKSEEGARARRKKSRPETIVTGELEPLTKKKALLG
jgi:hypothetical protein